MIPLNWILKRLFVVVTLFFGLNAFAQVNLTPYQPGGWSDKIVVSTVTGTSTDAGSLSTLDTVYVDWAVANFGSSAAGGFSIAMYVDGSLKQTWSVASMNASSYTYVLDYSLGTLTAGSHTIQIVADSGNTVAESNEADNSYTKTINVANSSSPNLVPYQPAGWSDKIVVSTGTGTSTDSSPLYATNTLYVDWAVTNSGGASAGAFTTALYVDSVLRNTWTNNSLGVGFATAVVDYSIGSLSVGSHTIQIVADAGNTVTEGSEADNSYTRNITISSPTLPNLTPYQIAGWSDKIVISTVTGTSTDNASPTIADTLYLDWAVINSGTASSGSFSTSLYVDGVLKNSWGSGALNVNGYGYVQDYALGSLSAGSHTITITADVANAVVESDETDNSYSKVINVASISIPAPTLLTPTTGSLGVATTPSFTWNSVTNATSYRIMVATNAADLPTSATASTGGTSLVINNTSATTNFTAKMPINPGVTYYWQVHGRAGTNEVGTWSSVNSFTTVAPTAGLTIIPTYDSSITSDPQALAIQTTINSAIAQYAAKIADPITVSITFKKMSSGLGSSSWYVNDVSYTSYCGAIESHMTSVDDTNANNSLPFTITNPVNGDPNLQSSLPLLRALGYSNQNPPPSQTDGTIFLNIGLMNVSGAQTDSSKYALFGVVCHEIDEVLGFSSALNGLTNGAPAPTGPVFPEDLFRYDQNGARSFTTSSSAQAYFSIDGITQIARFNQTQGGDFQDWYSPTGNPQVQDAYGTPGATPVLGSSELRALDVIGYTLAGSQATLIATAGSGGTISPSGGFNVTVGSSQLFTATPATNSFVSQWLVDGSVVQSGGTTYTLSNIQTNHTVQVTFGTKTNQTITFGALANKVYGNPTFGLSATASSGLPVSFSIVSGPATISSGTNVTITGTGTVVVRASQAGNTSYNAAPNVDQSFTVSPANQTITFGALANKVYGAATFGVSATASSGLPVSFSIFSGPATISGTNVTITGTGTVVVRASQAGNTNYNAAPNVDQSFSVSPASQTITFGTLTNKVYGDATFGVAATASSGLPVSFSVFSGPATISGTNVTITGAGTIVVRASQAGNTNYNAAANVDQSFNVAKASQTITFATLASKVYGDPTFGVNATASSGMAVSFSIFSGPATISGTNVTITGAGTVVVRASQAGDTNYNAAANVDQSFVVAKANQTITFGVLPNRTVGESPFTIAATASSGLSVAFSVLSGPATVAGSTVTVTNAGTVSIRATQSGDTNYNAAANVDQSFTVYGSPALATTISGTNIVLSWATNVAGFSLMSADNLGATWIAVSPSPVVANGQYVVTNSLAGASRFYLLKK